MSNRLKANIQFALMKEVEVLLNSPRVNHVTSKEFADEMTRELGCEITVRNIETCVTTFGKRLSDVFKNQSSGRSIYADVYKLEQRVAALEKKLSDLM